MVAMHQGCKCSVMEDLECSCSPVPGLQLYGIKVLHKLRRVHGWLHAGVGHLKCSDLGHAQLPAAPAAPCVHRAMGRQRQAVLLSCCCCHYAYTPAQASIAERHAERIHEMLRVPQMWLTVSSPGCIPPEMHNGAQGGRILKVAKAQLPMAAAPTCPEFPILADGQGVAAARAYRQHPPPECRAHIGCLQHEVNFRRQRLISALDGSLSHPPTASVVHCSTFLRAGLQIT